jgi:hypothetical protein
MPIRLTFITPLLGGVAVAAAIAAAPIATASRPAMPRSTTPLPRFSFFRTVAQPV